jgi:hypothetical protein
VVLQRQLCEQCVLQLGVHRNLQRLPGRADRRSQWHLCAGACLDARGRLPFRSLQRIGSLPVE